MLVGSTPALETAGGCDHGCDMLFPADWFGVRPPHGLDLSHVRAPKYLQVLEMQKRLRSSAVRSGSSGALAMVDGLVDTDLTVRYADVAAQWRRLPGPDGKPSRRKHRC
jgi:hypothetical protein